MKQRSRAVAVRSRARPASKGHEALITAYARVLAELRQAEGAGAKHFAYDDLPNVEILSPAVKPKGVKPEQIRKAVRKAIRDFTERHSKSFAQT